jgi:SAM-dependent methyltransferase
VRALGHRVVGVDGSPTLVRAAAEHPEPLHPVLADASRLPLRSAVADLVTALFVQHDVDDLEGTIAEAGRVLLPGGAFYFSIVHPLNSATEVPSYFESRRTSMTVEREGLRMTFESTHHPLGRYSRALEAAGFVIEAMREPVPDDAWVRDRPSAVKWRRFPHALHVRARRIGGGLA